MKTIAFYSYKGGVGRTLAIGHVAYWLSKQGQRVFLLDMDLEAPGLHYKLGQYHEAPVPEMGLVDYIGHFVAEQAAAPSLEDYVIKLVPKELEMQDMWLMPAGNQFTTRYWDQLAAIEWKDFLYGPEKLGALMFLELKAHIEKAYEPDFFLIDTRTGLTDLTGVGLDLLADDAVILGVNNDENLDGCRMVMEKLRQRDKLPFKPEKTRMHFVLTRIPAPTRRRDRDRETEIIRKAKARLNADSGLASGPLVTEVSVVHIDPEQAIQERIRFRDRDWDKYPILMDYIDLVYRVTGIGHAAGESFWGLYRELSMMEDGAQKTRLARKLLSFKSNVPEQEFVRGLVAHEFLMDRKSAISAYNNALRNRPEWVDALINRGNAYSEMADKQHLALVDYAEAIRLAPDDPDTYNNRACLLLTLGRASEALKDAEAAVRLRPDYPLFLGTLAEVHSALGHKDLFYQFLIEAISLDPSILQKLDSATLKRHENDRKFKRLLEGGKR